VAKAIKKIGVIGEGKMGSSIFLYLNGFDFRLTWLCSSEPEAEKARKTIRKKLKLQLQIGVLNEQEFESKTENSRVTSFAKELEDCDLIIEAVSEDIDVKRNLIESIDKIVNERCIITSNSSSFRPSQLITSGNRRDKIAGLHFFFPVNLKNTVELITGAYTSTETRETLDQFLFKIKKKPFHQDDANAFILNRLLVDFQAEAFNIVNEKRLSFTEIDEIVKNRFFPVGVFEFFDHVGIDVMLSSIRSYTHNCINKEFYEPLFLKLEELTEMNHLGMKTKHGIYNYSDQQEEAVQPRLENEKLTEYKNNVAERLWGHYIGSVNSVLDSGICSRDELALHVKDYMGMDRDPFIRGMQV
jgi:3-hydroxybutyryl-CoA dehydrogenase